MGGAARSSCLWCEWVGIRVQIRPVITVGERCETQGASLPWRPRQQKTCRATKAPSTCPGTCADKQHKWVLVALYSGPEEVCCLTTTWSIKTAQILPLPFGKMSSNSSSSERGRLDKGRKWENWESCWFTWILWSSFLFHSIDVNLLVLQYRNVVHI